VVIDERNRGKKSRETVPLKPFHTHTVHVCINSTVHMHFMLLEISEIFTFEDQSTVRVGVVGHSREWRKDAATFKGTIRLKNYHGEKLRLRASISHAFSLIREH
jgi:hypothetical protein